MACQASARVARGWINSSGRLHGGRALVRDGRGKLLFLRMFVFYFFHCHSGRLHGRLYGPVATNTIPSAPGRERGEKRFLREAFWWAVRPWRDSTLSSSCPADQEDAGGAGSNAILGRGPWRFGKGWRLAERERPRVCWVWQAEGRKRQVQASRAAESAQSGATLSSCWAGALGQEVSHSLWRLLCFCEALSESFHRRSKEAAGGNRSIKEGDLVRVLNLRQREPQVALEHTRGHRPSYGLGGGLGGSQSQVCCTSQLPESRRIRLRLVYGREELGLIDL